MTLDEKTRSLITDCVDSLPNWSEYAGHAAIVLTGSFAAGLADEQSDIDVEVLLPEPAYSEMYELLWQAVDIFCLSSPDKRRCRSKQVLGCLRGAYGSY